jgi:hypothetical protein
MKVKNGENANIPSEKITGYSLSKAHPIGKTKAAFFERIGYTLENERLLVDDLKAIVKWNEVAKTIDTGYGKKYIIRGTIGIRFGKNVPVVTIWLVEEGDTNPRFVTAYPDR